MSAPVGYPLTCVSLYCGRVLCDGCENRPRLAAYYRDRGDLERYERRQAELREKAEREKMEAAP